MRHHHLSSSASASLLHCLRPLFAVVMMAWLTSAAHAQTISSLSPATRTVNTGGFTLTVNGTGFTKSSVVQWSNGALSTTYGSATLLTASVPASLNTSVGLFPITVSGSPSSGFTIYPAFTFTVNPTKVTGGTSATGTIALSVPTLSNMNVRFSYDKSGATVANNLVQIKSGASSATFPITTTSVSSATNVTITASNSNTTQTATLTVNSSAGAPTNLVVFPRNTQLFLNWTGVDNASSYNVYRSTTKGGEGSTAYRTGVLGTSFLDQFTEGSTTYYYRVSAIVASKETAQSNEAYLMTNAALDWIAQPRTGVPAPGPGIQDYDWTGLTFTHDYYGTKSDGTQGSHSTKNFLNTRLYTDNTGLGLDNSSSYIDTSTGYSYGEDDLSQYGYHDGTWSVSGKSTYKWLWTPPTTTTDNTRPYNDPSQSASAQPYPLPQLFVLAKTAPYAQIAALESGVTTATIAKNMTVTGSASDPASSTPTGKITSVTSGTYTASDKTVTATSSYPPAPRYSILTGTADGSNSLMDDFTMQPSFIYKYSVTNSNITDPYSQLADLYGEVQEDVYPLALVAPDPFVRPDYGDLQGYTNQFVYYDTGVKDKQGYDIYALNIPAEISVATKTKIHGTTYNASAADLNWLTTDNQTSSPVSHVVFGVDTAVFASLQPYSLYTQFDLAHGIIGPNAKGQDMSGNPVPVLTLSGLPTANSDLGKHFVNLRVRADASQAFSSTSNSQQAVIQTFFDGNDAYFPDPWSVTTDGKPISNWWYYYNQVYSVTGSFTFNDSQSKYGVNYLPDSDNPNGTASNGNHVSFAAYKNDTIHQSSRNDTISINPLDAHADPNGLYPNFGLRVFALNSSGKLRYVGDLIVPGIYQAITVFGHEQGHVDTYTQYAPIDAAGQLPPSGWIYTLATAGSTTNADYSHDNSDPTKTDNIWDGWEDTHGMSRSTNNSTGADYGMTTDSNIPDNQVTADIQALGRVMANLQQDSTHIPAWQQDWDISGCQFNTSIIPQYYIEERYGHKTDTNGEVIQTLSPSEASATPVFYLRFRLKPNTDFPTENQLPKTAGGLYEIRNLADLKMLYSGVKSDVFNWTK